jgi:hypothetical protein
VYSACVYPIEWKKWIRSVPAKSAAAIEWTGASPQRCHFVYNPQSGRIFFWFSSKGERKNLKGSLQYLIVEATTTIEVLEKRGIGLTAP